MEQATRNKLRNVVTQCRKLLDESIAQQLQGTFGIYAGKKDAVQIEDEARMSHLSEEDKQYRNDLLDHLEHIKARSFNPKDALDQLIRETAFTHLNRLCAYKMMEARDVYVGGQKFRECVSRGINSNGFKFYLADHPDDERLFNTGDQETAYRHFLDWVGSSLSEEIGTLFNPNDPANRLYPRQKTLDELLELLNDEELTGTWEQDETIGWVYQYFTPKELRDQARKESSAPRNSYELAFRNQFFTPRYVVEFLTDNTLGRIWYEMRKGETKLNEQCRYMVRRPNEVFLDEGQEPPEIPETQDDLSQKDLLKQPVYISHRSKKDPRELKILDPAAGSGHFLLYCFDLLLTIYEEAYADPDLHSTLQQDYPTLDDLRRNVPRLILAHNLHGIDIDLRATQIAALALWLRCQRAYQSMGLKMERLRITRSHFVCAEPMPGEEKMLKEFVDKLQPKLLGQLVEVIFEKMKLAGEAGSLLRIEQDIRDTVVAAKKQWLAGPPTIQRSLFDDDEPVRRQHTFEFSDITNAEFFEQAESRVVEALRSYAEQDHNGKRLQRRLFSDDAVRGFAFVDLCRQKFDVVLMNPPFGLPTDTAFSYLKSTFPTSYTELLATFVERAIQLCCGIGGAITSRSFMVATRLKNWRHDLLIDRLSTLADLGAGVMDAALVESAAYTFLSTPVPNAVMLGFDVRNDSNRSTALFSAIQAESQGHESTHRIIPAVFKKFPNYKILYALPPRVIDLLQSPKKFEPMVGTARQGLTTWDDFRFIRLRWEVCSDLIGANKRWEHLAKGGAFGRYYGDVHLLLGWDGDGKDIRAANIRVNGTDAQSRQASDYWRRPGNTYSLRSGKGFSVRVLPKDCLFTSQGPVIFSESDVSNIAILGWINSELMTTLVEVQSNAGKFMSGIIKTLPWHDMDPHALKSLEDRTLDLVAVLRNFCAMDETDTYFSGLPIKNSVAGIYRSVSEKGAAVKSRIIEIDEEWNQLVNRTYAIEQRDIRHLRELNVFGDDGDTIAKDEENNELRLAINEVTERLLSLCMGTLFGRWDVNKIIHQGSVAEDKNPYDPLPSSSPVSLKGIESNDGHMDSVPMEFDGDGILADDLGHQDDIVQRLREVLEFIWKDRADAIEKEVCEILGVKTLRDYFRKPNKGGFWDDHVKRYSKSRRKAPIYWLLQSSKKNYALWLYYHRLDKDMLFKALLNYVEPKIQREENRLGELRSLKSSAGDSGKEAKKIDRDTEKQEDLLSELRDFEEKLRKVADMHLVPDLNDGVVLNIAPLHELVPWKEAKKYWNELMDGKYEWSSIGKQLREKGLVK